jgi:hypothetical protein
MVSTMLLAIIGQLEMRMIRPFEDWPWRLRIRARRGERRSRHRADMRKLLGPVHPRADVLG